MSNYDDLVDRPPSRPGKKANPLHTAVMATLGTGKAVRFARTTPPTKQWQQTLYHVARQKGLQAHIITDPEDNARVLAWVTKGNEQEQE